MILFDLSVGSMVINVFFAVLAAKNSAHYHTLLRCCASLVDFNETASLNLLQ